MTDVVGETYCLDELDLVDGIVYCEEFPDHKGPHMAAVWFHPDGSRLRVSWEWEKCAE